MEIRKSELADVPKMMEIFQHARSFMKEHGNPNQWAKRNWPPIELIYNDIKEGKSYVCTNDDGRIIGTFFMDYGKNVEKTYLDIENGSWTGDDTYGVVHRIASDGSQKGIGTFCIDWAYSNCGRHLRMDTHGDNYVMQNLLKKIGFKECGIIYVVEDNYPRIAYERYEGNKDA